MILENEFRQKLSAVVEALPPLEEKGKWVEALKQEDVSKENLFDIFSAIEAMQLTKEKPAELDPKLKKFFDDMRSEIGEIGKDTEQELSKVEKDVSNLDADVKKMQAQVEERKKSNPTEQNLQPASPAPDEKPLVPDATISPASEPPTTDDQRPTQAEADRRPTFQPPAQNRLYQRTENGGQKTEDTSSSSTVPPDSHPEFSSGSHEIPKQVRNDDSIANPPTNNPAANTGGEYYT